MRLNNYSARLLVNKWLDENGYKPLSSGLSYLEFATKLREITAKKQVKVPFVLREDAVAYVRYMAKQLTKENENGT